MPTKTTTEARQGTGPRAMFWVLISSLTLAVIAGLRAWMDFPPLGRGLLTGPTRKANVFVLASF